jgi:hypothetical protein
VTFDSTHVGDVTSFCASVASVVAYILESLLTCCNVFQSLILSPSLPWTATLAVFVLLTPVLTFLFLRGRRSSSKSLPTEWAVTARPVFSADERRIYRILREALPHHVILSKLPLLRFCQPTEPTEVRYWYELLGANHVTFAICNANGRVLAAIDLDSDRGNSRRTLQIKQSVLGACGVRYVRCPVNHLPSVAELQLLVPKNSTAPGQAQPAQTLNQARRNLSSTMAHRRAERTAMWQDSTLNQDSFFAPDSRLDAFLQSEFASSDRQQ